MIRTAPHATAKEVPASHALHSLLISRLSMQMLIFPRVSAAHGGGDIFACVAAILRAAAAAAPSALRVAALVHCGTITLEADWLWSAYEASTIRILPAGPAVDEVRSMEARGLAGGVLVSRVAAVGRERAIRKAGLVATGGDRWTEGGEGDAGAGEVALALREGPTKLERVAVGPRRGAPSLPATVQTR